MNWFDQLKIGKKKANGDGESKARGRRFFHRRLSERGQSMVEMAFLLPIFLAMVFAIIEIGRAWATKQSLTIAAREGARVLVLPYGGGLVYTSESAVKQAAIDKVSSYLTSSGVPVGSVTQISVVRVRPGADYVYNTPDDVYELNYTNGIRGDRVGIQINHTFETALPYVLTMFNSQKNNSTGILMGVTCFMDHE